MELHPPLAPPEPDETDVSRSQGATVFLAAIAREHARFIDTLAGASSVLAGSPGRLAPAAAAFARSTRQYLDAQRALLAMWADTDATLTRIVEATELDVALLGIELDDCQPATPFANHAPVTTDALDSRLRAVLDDWWREGNRDASALVEECRARNAAVLHIARSQAPETWAAPLVGAVAETDSTPPPTHLPATIVEALDGADASSVDAVLATLLQQLADPEPVADDVPGHDADVAATAERALRRDPDHDRHDLRLVGPDEAFERFWGAPRLGHASPRRTLFAHTLLPLVSVVGALTLVLAWIG